MTENLYEILGLDPNNKSSYSAQDFKKAYRKASLKYHPDKQGGKSDAEKKEAEEMFKKCSQAYEVLSDDQKRQRYDMFGTVDDNPSSGGYSNPFSDFGFDFGDIRDIFGGRGGFGGSGQSRERVVPGQSIQMEVPLSLKDIYTGTTKKLKYRIDTRCRSCHGTGGKTKTCPHCNGSGVITKVQRTAFGVMQQQTPCPHCNGTGQIIEDRCKTCNGTGFEKTEKIQEVTFPAGAQQGEYVNIHGGGSEAKKAGHPNGDFIAIAKWNFDTKKYSINGADIIEQVYIPYEDCILGTSYDVVLPDDSKLNISIPELSQPGKRLQLRGRGLKLRDGYGRLIQGNYIIVINYILPETLSEEEKVCLENIWQMHNADSSDNEAV